MHKMSEDIQERKSPTIYDHLAILLDQLSGVAWQKLGLQPDMITGKIEPDLTQAKVAIDVVSYLSSQLESQLDEEDRKHIHSLVRDLKDQLRAETRGRIGLPFQLEVAFHKILEVFGGNFRTIDEIHEARGTQGKLISFDLRFRDLVELMASAQRYGVTNGGNAQYLSLKRQVSTQYKELRPFLLAFIRFDIEDERMGLRTIGVGTDAFEAIWVAASLDDFVISDDVFFRDRVARAKLAIRDYTEHLHCLLETRV
jgi:hypothetical protein